ncbi:MAG: ComF family protein [Atopobiaceae bacterium]|nr:double zinc ribbon domain-containing protein [Atopobiaceae bacterium]MCH4180279.1 double zinc ribbon domain-containing protein [Atopobiaceae bacterium]MCH4214765.1 double zinc ribbon domain-containing protein [Atopobiaceae bacterium]MCH4229991.1 double zinc ribbon domain-containing protein [Atopobiaceae bacterium]MCH4276926.1 double zinc ribbon domain-containing protein [Atopobiaceae bacterium]
MPIPRLSDIADDLLELAYPTRCLGCDDPGELLCPDCRAALPWIAQRWACPTCGAPFGWLTCTECTHDWEPRATVCALSHEGTAARMVVGHKDAHERRLAPVMAAALACALDEAAAWPAADGRARFDAESVDGICFVPASPAAYARRGFDHMEAVAHELARFEGLPVMDVLARRDAADQRTLGKEARARNVSGTFFLAEEVAGVRLLLIDDVATTGSSVRSAAATLLAHGAGEVTACTFARVW